MQFRDPCDGLDFTRDLELNPLQRCHGHVEKIPTATGRVEYLDRPQLGVKRSKPVHSGLATRSRVRLTQLNDLSLDKRPAGAHRLLDRYPNQSLHIRRRRELSAESVPLLPVECAREERSKDARFHLGPI